MSAREALADAPPGRFTEGEISAHYRMRDPGSDRHPQLMEMRYEPNAEIQVHAHDEFEIVYVLAGEMHLGGRTLGPGSTLAITGGTFYGFKAGPDGLQFLNFRPRQDTTFHTSRETSKTH
jgi:quercetin dioxygenase-like cupin family protein